MCTFTSVDDYVHYLLFTCSVGRLSVMSPVLAEYVVCPDLCAKDMILSINRLC